MKQLKPTFFLMTCAFLLACQPGIGVQNSNANEADDAQAAESNEFVEDDLEFIFNDNNLSEKSSCAKASAAQIAVVNQGNEKKEKFFDTCLKATNNSPWCDQLLRPNPSSKSTFQCTYGASQVHQLIHPDENTWQNAYEAVNIVEELIDKNICVSLIYNWWRPEPYNKNVGGAAGRHPHGTSVDVRFCKKSDQSAAFKELCKMRKQGRLRAIGYYSSTALHFGIGDSAANTWGKSCN